MLLIEDKYVEPALLRDAFACDLSVCKGACCEQGDGGAPLSFGEAQLLKQENQAIKPYLTDAGRAVIDREGTAIRGKGGTFSTPLIEGGLCAYARKDGSMIWCGIEQAQRASATTLPKPLSCYLYPIRVDRRNGQDHLRYHRWHICHAACARGKSLGLRVYQFLREPIIRAWGERFYEALDAAAKAHYPQPKQN